MTDSLNNQLKQSICNNWEKNAFSDYGSNPITYGDVARKIAQLHILMQEAGITPRDKVALCGKNSSQWAVAFLASITYGAIPVPILNDFKADSIEHITAHSDSRLLWADETIWNSLDSQKLPQLQATISLADYKVLSTRKEGLQEYREQLDETFAKQYPGGYTKENIKYFEGEADDAAVINYTSGSTGFSKGVILPYRSLSGNLKFCVTNLDALRSGDNMISMLPLAHMYGLMIEMLHPFAKGCHTHFLGRTPSPKILLEAFATVQPRVIIAVPLIIEKIMRNRVMPALNKPLLRFAMHIPGVDKLILGKVRKQLITAFGGNLHQIIIGGAALNRDIETLLRRMKFPYTVGYGMTECGPLLAYAPWDVTRMASCGRIVTGMEGRIVPLREGENVGELWVKGDHVMLGYYKNDEATESVIKDGWMNTGDLCTVDKEGFIYIHGRNKNMILGPSGQNIYPEEIEDKLNNLPYVAESLIVERGGMLHALIVPDYETLRRENIEGEALQQLMTDNHKALNKMLPGYSQISQIEIRKEEFEKTPKRSIKRYLYQ